MNKILAATAATLALLLVPACSASAHSLKAAASVTPLGTGINFGLGQTFSTDAQAVGNTFMLYDETDPDTASATSVTEPGVTWTSLGEWDSLGKTYGLWHGVATQTGRATASVALSGPYAGSVELGWQQFVGGTQAITPLSTAWQGTTVEFPDEGSGYFWAYAKSTGAITCPGGPRCIVTPQENAVLSGNFTGTPTEQTTAGSQGFTVEVKLIP